MKRNVAAPPLMSYVHTNYTQKNVLLNQQKFGWPNKAFRLNMGQWKFLLIQQNIFLGASKLCKQKMRIVFCATKTKISINDFIAIDFLS